MGSATGVEVERGEVIRERDYRFTIEQHGEYMRCIFEFRRLPDDRRLGCVVAYLYKSSAPLVEATNQVKPSE